MGQRTGFLLQGDTAAERIVDTGTNWKVCRADAYAPFRADRDRLHTFVVVGPGDEFDAVKHPWGWQEVKFDEAGWAEFEIPIEEEQWASREMTRIGAEIEVLSPPGLRARMAAIARKLARLYGLITADGATPPSP